MFDVSEKGKRREKGSKDVRNRPSLEEQHDWGPKKLAVIFFSDTLKSLCVLVYCLYRVFKLQVDFVGSTGSS